MLSGNLNTYANTARTILHDVVTSTGLVIGSKIGIIAGMIFDSMLKHNFPSFEVPNCKEDNLLLLICLFSSIKGAQIGYQVGEDIIYIGEQSVNAVSGIAKKIQNNLMFFGDAKIIESNSVENLSKNSKLCR